MSNQAKRLSDCPAERLAQCRGGDDRTVVAERTPQDYAIEHAGYLATAADSVQEAYKAYSLAQMNLTEGGDDGEGELSDLVDGARDDLHEALQDLRGMAYEFRKRRDRAIPL
ncbi:hypothetical protein [Pseudomonas syringae]